MKRCVTVSLHHEVLEAWEKFCNSSAVAPQVLSLDFHTDTLNCQRRNIPLPDNAAAAVRVLHHDEHFDWALRTGMISRAVIIALSPCAAPPEHPALEVRNHPDMPELQTLLNDPDHARPFLENVLSDNFLFRLLPDGFPRIPYILDIDCDFILCAKALQIPPGSLLIKLASQAGLITISEENDWVKILKLPGEILSGTTIAGKLTGILT
ncbi:MAG: hypothetical protein IKC94_01485 [Lentisphaeria bacterium]|nr:hypothetical protein [Lentisphaeria bacterium]